MAASLRLDYAYQFILQLGHVNDGMKHCIIALGCLGESLCLPQGSVHDSEQAVRPRHFALLQYGKALESLQTILHDRTESSQSLILVLCFLFSVFEFLSGNEIGSLVHLHSGIKLLREQTQPMSCDNLTYSMREALSNEIRRSFRIMDNETTLWLGHHTWHTSALMPEEDIPPYIAPSMIDRFTSLDEASAALTYHINRMLHFRRRVVSKNFRTGTQEIPPAALAHHQALAADFKTWHERLENFIQVPSPISVSADIIDRIALLRLNYTSTLAVFNACIHCDKSLYYEQVEDQFRQAIAYAKTILLPVDLDITDRLHRIIFVNYKSPVTETGRGNSSGLFALYVGLIPPLFSTAVNCENRDIRSAAVNLLSTRYWREGPWNSLNMARVARLHRSEGRPSDYNPQCGEMIAHSLTYC